MTLNDVVIRIKERSHRGDILITSDTTTATIIRAINDARREVIRLLPKEWLRKTTTIPTVASQALYLLPLDCQEPLLFRYVYNNADYFLSKIESEREFYLNLWGTTIAPNKPLYAVNMGRDPLGTGQRQYQFFPTPDIIYTIFFTYQYDPTLTDLVVSGLSNTIPDIPNYLHDILYKGGLYHFLKGFDDPAQSTAKMDYDAAMLAVEVADERDLDSDLQFRMDVGRRITDFRSPGTGIRLK